MTAPVIADALGPRGRRRVAIASAISAALLVGVLVVATRRLQAKGQLDWERWRPLTQWSVMKFLLLGLVATLRAAAVGIVAALLLGGGFALMRLANTAPVRWFAAAWVEFFRGFPLLLLILFCFLVPPQYDIDITPFRALVVALSLYNGAMLAEVFRAGILSLDRGQSEAAYAIGMSYWQAMLLVVIPQAARRMTPAILSQLVALLKDTSLGYVIAFDELLRRGRVTGEYFKNPLQVTVAIALMYIVVNFTLTQIAQRLEQRQKQRYNAAPITVAGAEELTTTAA